MSSSARTSWNTVFAYGAPAVGAGYMYLLLALYVMKFCTDILLIAPAVMGLIFSISRFWDALSDPVAGYYSDRTKLALGRRRSWMLASILPIGLFFLMVFSPPLALTGFELTLWMAVAIIGFYGVMTIFFVPHLSLGAELTDNYHERSRLFGMRHAFYTVGSILALVTMQMLISAEATGDGAVRELAFDQGLLAGVVMAGLVAYAVVRLREPPPEQAQLESGPFQAFRDVARNPYARRLYVVWFIENVGGGAIAALTLYVTHYVVGAPQWAPAIILAYMVPSSFAVPLWVSLSRRRGKIRTWVLSMCLTGVSFGGMFSLPFIETMEARLWTIFILAFFAGLAAAGGGSIGPSVQGDVVDYDELRSGERKGRVLLCSLEFHVQERFGVHVVAHRICAAARRLSTKC